jgi:hypothetical protein
VEADEYFGAEVDGGEEEEEEEEEEDMVYVLGSENEIHGPYTLIDVTHWIDSGEMARDALVSVPSSMEMLHGTDWVEVQDLLDARTMVEYETWRKDDDNFEW